MCSIASKQPMDMKQHIITEHSAHSLTYAVYCGFLIVIKHTKLLPDALFSVVLSATCYSDGGVWQKSRMPL